MDACGGARRCGRPGFAVAQAFKRVRVTVKNATGNRQVSWDASSLTGDFYFKPAAFVAQSAPPSQPRVGQILKDCDACPEMVVIPGGTFTIGSPADEEGDRKGHIKKPQLLGAAGVSSEVCILKVEHLLDTDFPTASQARKRQAPPGRVFCT